MTPGDDVGRFAAELGAASARAGALAYGIVRHHGQLLTTRWKRRASQPRTTPRGPGTGGLRLFTGDYVRRVNLQMSAPLGQPTASAGTDHPGARRLEHGFQGADSLGRVYDQPPYPTAGPALDETEPGFVAGIAAIAEDLPG